MRGLHVGLIGAVLVGAGLVVGHAGILASGGRVTCTTQVPLVKGVTRELHWPMSPKFGLRPGGRHGLSSRETRDPIGFAVAAVNRLAQSELIDRVGLRKQAEQAVYSTTRNGFRAATAAGRTFARVGRSTAGRGPPRRRRAGSST